MSMRPQIPVRSSESEQALQFIRQMGIENVSLMLGPDELTAEAIRAQKNKLAAFGLRIPKDLSIVSFNNSLFSRITNPPLTTVDVNPYQLGIEAASQTINHIENPNLLATKIIVPHQLIVRESCCPPPEV